MSISVILLIVITISLTLLASVFAGSETAISSANLPKLQINLNQKKHVKTTMLSMKLIKKYTMSLTAIIVANNLIVIGFSTAVTFLFIQILTNYHGSVVTIVPLVYGTFILVIFGEILPKWFARKHPEKWVQVFSYFLYGTIILLYPFVKVLNLLLKDFKRPTATEPELLEIVKNVKKEGIIESQEEKLVLNAIKFDDKTADAILIPWSQVTYLGKQFTKEQILEIISNKNYHYFPIIDENTDSVNGLLDAKLFWQLNHNKKNFDLEECVKNPTFFSSKTFLDEIIKKMQQGHNQFCIIYNENNPSQILGIITMDDLIDELVGNIGSPSSSGSDVIIVGPNSYAVNGALNYNQFIDTYPFNNWNLKDDAYENVSMWVKSMKKSKEKVWLTHGFKMKVNIIKKKERYTFTKIKKKKYE